MLNGIGLIVIALFAYGGYRRGVVRMAASLLALALAGLFCQAFAGLGALPLGSRVPLVFQPLAGSLLAGLVLFVLFDFLLGIPIKRQAKWREEEELPKVSPWEAYTGLGLGIIWGLGILVVSLAGLNAIGRTQRAIRHSDAVVSYRAQHPGPWMTIPETQLILAAAAPAEIGSIMVEESIFSPLVTRVNPVDSKVEKTLSDLSVVCNDPQLYGLFQQHPKVQAFVSNPVLVRLSQDPEIARAIAEGNYRGLMDHPKIAGVAQDRALIRQLKELRIEELLEEVRQQSTTLPQR
jgi:hypothetical protein